MNAIGASCSYAAYLQTPDTLSKIRALPQEKWATLKRLIKDQVSTTFDAEFFPGGSHSVIDREGRNSPIGEAIIQILKDRFHNDPSPFITSIVNNSRALSQGKAFTYSLLALTSLFKTSSVFDQMVRNALGKAYKTRPNYRIGLGLNLEETKKRDEPVFSIFEKDGEKELSRKNIPASQL